MRLLRWDSLNKDFIYLHSGQGKQKQCFASNVFLNGFSLLFLYTLPIKIFFTLLFETEIVGYKGTTYYTIYHVQMYYILRAYIVIVL